MEKYKYLYKFNKKYNICLNISEYTNNELYLINKILYKNNLDNIIETNNSNILNYIGLISYWEYNKKEEAKKYYLMAINLNNSYAMNNYALLLENENKIEEAKEYYLMAINLNNSIAMNNYANLLYMDDDDNKIEEAKKYYLMAINLNNHKSINDYLIAEKNILKQYIYLIELKSDIAISHINKIKNNKDVIILSNKLKYYSKIENCNICMEENKVNVLLNCFYHYICKDCYCNLYNKPCPYCNICCVVI